ncbi:MAG: WG repeat-containing protein [bacterium]
MICINCNKQIDDDSKFCVYCGSQQVDRIEYSEGNLVPFKKGNKWGFKDKNTRDVIIPPKYSYVSKLVENRIILATNNKYAVADKNGNVLTPFKYDFISDFKNGFAKVKRDNKWTYLNSDCNEISSFQYSQVDIFENGVSIVKTETNKFILLNDDGKQLTREYDEIEKLDYLIKFISGFKLKKRNKIGLASISGKIILPCNFDFFNVITDNLIKVSSEDKYGLYSKDGNKLTEIEYDKIDEFREGLAIVEKKNKHGLINKFGEKIISIEYKKIKRNQDNSFIAKGNKGWMCFNNVGEDVTKSNKNFKNFNHRRKRKRRIISSIAILCISIFLIVDYHNSLLIFRNFYLPRNYLYNINRNSDISALYISPLEFKFDKIRNQNQFLNFKRFIQNNKFSALFESDSIQISKNKRIVKREKFDAEYGIHIKSDFLMIDERKNSVIKLMQLREDNDYPSKILVSFNDSKDLFLNVKYNSIIGKNSRKIDPTDGKRSPTFLYKINIDSFEYSVLKIKANAFFIVDSGEYINHIFALTRLNNGEVNYKLFNENGDLVKDFGSF